MMTAAITLQHNHSILALPIGVDSPASGDGLLRSRAYLNTQNGMGEYVAPEDHDPRTVATGAIGAIHIPGQLWERVAETPSNAPAPLTARQDEAIVRAYADRDIRERGGRGHSPAVCTDCPSASGIIRAGERIK